MKSRFALQMDTPTSSILGERDITFESINAGTNEKAEPEFEAASGRITLQLAGICPELAAVGLVLRLTGLDLVMVVIIWRL